MHNNIMTWTNLGLVAHPQTGPQVASHAQLPTPLVLDDCIRVYYMGRDHENRGRVWIADLDKNDPTRVLKYHPRPALDLGALGAFDDRGIAPSCAIRNGDEIWLYYTGISPRVTVSLSYAIGLAISRDGGITFERYSIGPIIDRTPLEGYLFASPNVLQDGPLWRMYYLCGTGWIDVGGRPEMLYDVRYAESRDGITWKRDGAVCVAQAHPEEAIARPWTFRTNSGYVMLYCYRGSRDFRDGEDAYKIGMALSNDGRNWQRCDDKITVAHNAANPKWDDHMQAYPTTVRVGDKAYMVFNGNSFGKDGFGVACTDASQSQVLPIS